MASIIQQTRDKLKQVLSTPIQYNPNSFGGKAINTTMALANKVERPMTQISRGLTASSTFGIVDLPKTPPATNLADKIAYGAGFGLGVVNPLNPLNKVSIGTSLFGEGLTNAVLGRVAPKATGLIAKKLLPAVGGELAQTALFSGGQYLGNKVGLNKIDNALSPANLASNVLIGTGLRGLGGFAPTPSVKNFHLDSKTFDELFQAGEILTNPKAYADSLGHFPRPGLKEEAVAKATKQALETIDRLAAKHLPDKILNKVAGDPLKTIKALEDLHFKNKLGNVPGMGFMGNNKPFTNPTDPFYNVAKSGTQNKEFLKDTVEGLKPQIEGVVGKTLGHDEVKAYANTVSDDLIKQVGRQQTLEMGAAQLRLRQTIAQMADEGTVTKDFLERIKADKSFSENSARLLGQRNIVADASTPAGKMKQQLLKNILDVNENLDEIVKKAEGVNFDDPKAAAAFYREYIKPSAGDWIDKLRYNSMLSSPKTHITNIVSNLEGTGIITPIQKTIEGALDKAIAGVTGRDRTRFTGEGAQYAKGYYTSVGKAWGNMVDVLKGKTLSENPDTRNIPLATSGIKRGVEVTLDMTTRSLEAMDQFFGTLTRGGLEEAYKYRMGKGVPLAKGAAQEAEDLLFRGKLTSKGQGAVSNAVGAGAEWVKKATQSPNKAFRWTAKLTLPFINIGTNLLKAGLEGNPVTGSINMIGNEDRIAQAAKIIMGGSVMATGSVLAMGDNITFEEPRSEKERNAYRQAGLTPYSIKVGDTWYSYDKAHPLVSFQLATVAAIHDALKNKKITDSQATTIAKGLAKTVAFYADQSYMKNVGDFYSAVSGDLSGWQRYAANYPSQAIPYRALGSWITRLVDKYQRQPDTDAGFVTRVYQQIAAGTPGLSQTVPARRGPAGLPIEQPNRVANAFYPGKVSTENKGYKNVYDIQTQSKRFADIDGTVRDLIKQGQTQEAIKLIRDNKELYAKGGIAKQTQGRIDKYTEARRKVEKDARLTPAQKEKVYAALSQIMQKDAQSGVQMIGR